MLNIGSFLFAIVAAVIVLPGILPLFGWLNWLALPFAGIGIALGALSNRTIGRNVNIVVFLVAVVRLSIGGGVL